MNLINRLDDMQSEVCDNLCKYRDTADADMICDYMREHEGSCPLDVVTKFIISERKKERRNGKPIG